MRSAKRKMVSLFFLAFLTGCSQLIDYNPLFLLTGQSLTVKRTYVAKGRIKVKGKSTQQIVDLLGEPSGIYVYPQEGVEHWEFIYYQPFYKEVSGKKQVLRLIIQEGRVVGIQKPNDA